MKKVEKADVQIRIQTKDFHNAIYGICEKQGLKIGKIFNNGENFTFSIPAPAIIENAFFIGSDAGYLKQVEMMLDEISELVLSTTVLIAVYFVEDMSEFSVLQTILNFCSKTDSRLWVYTYPKGDWSLSE